MTVFKIKLKKGDMVKVIRGRLRGQTGRIQSILPKTNQVVLEKVNIVKRHLKPNMLHPQGGIVEIEKPLRVSQIALIEPTNKKPTRVGFEFDKDGKKYRIYKSTKKPIEDHKLTKANTVKSSKGVK